MAHSRNPAESVVALLVVLGLRTVEVLGIETLATGGLKAWKPADVSFKTNDMCIMPRQQCFKHLPVCFVH